MTEPPGMAPEPSLSYSYWLTKSLFRSVRLGLALWWRHRPWVKWY